MHEDDYPDYENNTSVDDYNFNYDDYMYPGYSFEKPVYLYIWEILVIVTFLVNIVVISVFLHRKMRNPTNLILVAIAISDSLTGLVTLPTYIMAYSNFEPARSGQSGGFNLLNTPSLPTNPGPQHTMIPHGNHSPEVYPLNPTITCINEHVGSHCVKGKVMGNTSTNFSNYGVLASGLQSQEGYKLTKSLCTGFMISKFFLSEWFHTISIYLTLFVCIQRFISVVYPFQSQSLFSGLKTLCYCGIVFVVSMVLHLYHLTDDKAQKGLCQWDLPEKGCKGGCVYLWVIFLTCHFIPCTAMIVMTALIIKELIKSEQNFRKTHSSTTTLMHRIKENRRVTVIVIAVVIAFLIPEVPYVVFLFYNAVEKTIRNGKGIDLEANRAIHMAYELLLVLSFHANFYIYMLYNRRFRKTLKHTFIYSMLSLFGDSTRFSRSASRAISQSSFEFKRSLSKGGMFKSGRELKSLNPGESSPTNKSTGKIETPLGDYPKDVKSEKNLVL